VAGEQRNEFFLVELATLVRIQTKELAVKLSQLSIVDYGKQE
jgi:hypothetical protein